MVPPIEGLRTGEYLTNETVFSLIELPARLVVIGSGPLGCELAQAFRRLGSEVDLVSDTTTVLPNDEPEVGELIRRRFEQEGLRLHLGFTAVRAGTAAWVSCRHLGAWTAGTTPPEWPDQGWGSLSDPRPPMFLPELPTKRA